MPTRNQRKQSNSPNQAKWETQYLETHEKKWLDEAVLKLPLVDMSEGINQNALDNICDKALLSMKFKSDKWEIFLNDPTKRKCFKYKKFEEYIYLHLNREAPAGDQAQQSTQPTIEQSQVDQEASAEIPDSQQSFAPTNSNLLESAQSHSNLLESAQPHSSLLESTQPCSNLLESTQNVPEDPEPATTTTKGYGMTTIQAIKAHKPSMLDFNFSDLPDYEVYEMNGKGLSVLKHNKRYAEFFKEVCLEQIELLESMAFEEQNLAIGRKSQRQSRREYNKKCDDFCSSLKKRADRPDTESEDDACPNEDSYQIPKR